jgi:SAM-dependent methyltransferase
MAINGPDGQDQPALSGAAPSGPYWNAVYRRRGAAGVSWFQATPQMSLSLIRALGIPRHTAVVDAGAGAGALTGHLAAAGFTDLTAVDVSAAALDAARQRLTGQPGVTGITWIRADLLSWRPGRRYGLWHDRAVFHFLTEPGARAAYLATVRAALTPGGAVILATFAPDGPGYCSGLPVARYSAGDLARALGTGFTLTAARSEQHVTPDGAIQPFTWVAGTFTSPPCDRPAAHR